MHIFTTYTLLSQCTPNSLRVVDKSLHVRAYYELLCIHDSIFEFGLDFIAVLFLSLYPLDHKCQKLMSLLLLSCFCDRAHRNFGFVTNSTVTNYHRSDLICAAH